MREPLTPTRGKGSADFGAALQARALGNRVLLTADVRSSTLSGEARRAGLDGVFFRADEQVVDASVELRYQPERLVHELERRSSGCVGSLVIHTTKVRT
ncbi:MAG: hypothetical protein IH965_08895 [Gemmatimonadetes bacterium]|nr:hypothetical protein [Gemmatimonadota bacterium]